MVARCVELIYEKHAFENKPDITYLNGGPGKKLMVEKVDYDTKSPIPTTIKSIMRLTALDATIFESGDPGNAGGGGGWSKVIARGPGKTQERPARNASVARTVWFEDEMEMLTWHDGLDPMPTPSPLAARSLAQPRGEIVRGTLRRLLTLKGVSKLVDHNTATTLDARKSIVAEFQAEPNLPPLKGEGPAQIKWLDAYEDAHLTAPSKALTARVFLKAKFEQPPAPPKPVASPIVPGAVPAGPLVAAEPAPTPPPTKLEAEPKPLPAEPLVDGRADRVWANVQLGSPGEGGASPKGELKNAQLRGSVMVHQDPAPDKILGNDASGEALDLTNQGNGLMKFVVKREDPEAFDPKTKFASSKGRSSVAVMPMAMVQTEGKTIESEDIIWLDQKIDYLCVRGPGSSPRWPTGACSMTKGSRATSPRQSARPGRPARIPRIASRSVGTARCDSTASRSTSKAEPPPRSSSGASRSRSARPEGRREFRRGVEAKMTDSSIFTDTMDVYMDPDHRLQQGDRQAARQPRRAQGDRPPDRHARLQGQGLLRERHPQVSRRRHPELEALSRGHRDPREAAHPGRACLLRQADRQLLRPGLGHDLALSPQEGTTTRAGP